MLVIGRKNNELLIFQNSVNIRVAYDGLTNNHPEFCRLYRGTRKIAGFTRISDPVNVKILGYDVTLMVTRCNESNVSIGIEADMSLRVSRNE